MSPAVHSMRRQLAIVCLALLALLIAVALSQPLWLAPWLSERLSAASGRSVRFERMWVGLSATFEPVIHVHGVRIANASWADARRPFAELDEVVVVFSWRSLHEHRPVLRLVVLRDGRVDFERDAEGLRNWRLQHPQDRGPGRVRIMALQADRASVRFVHRGLDLEIEAAAAPNPARAAGNGSRSAMPTQAAAPATTDPLPTQIDFKGVWRGVEFVAKVESEPVLTFLETGKTFALRGRLEAGGARLDVDGRAGDVASDPIIDARVALAASTLAPFRSFVGGDRAGARPMRIAGRLIAADRRYTLSALEARVGASDFAGEATYAHRGERGWIRADLKSESTAIADVLWLAGRDASLATGGASHRSAAAGESSSGAHGWRSFDGELRFESRHVQAAALPTLQGLKLDAALADGVLKLTGLDLGIAHGRVTGQAMLDLSRAPPRAEADIAARGLRLEALWRGQATSKRVTGALQGRATLDATGDSAAALRAGMSGRVSAALTGGTISSLLDAEMGLQGGKILRSLIGGSEALAIECAVASVDLRRGVGTMRTLVIDTERTRTTGAGTIDLGDATVDLVLTPQAKRGGLFVLDRSIRLHGPLLKPEHALVDRAPASRGATCAA